MAPSLRPSWRVERVENGPGTGETTWLLTAGGLSVRVVEQAGRPQRVYPDPEDPTVVRVEHSIP